MGVPGEHQIDPRSKAGVCGVRVMRQQDFAFLLWHALKGAINPNVIFLQISSAATPDALPVSSDRDDFMAQILPASAKPVQ